MSEFVYKEVNGYKILFFQKDNVLYIYVQDQKRKGENKKEFLPSHQRFKESFQI